MSAQEKPGNTLDIMLMGREYHVACPPEERVALKTAVSYVDEKMHEIAGKTKSSGERLAVMTALNLAHELLSMKYASAAGGATSNAGSGIQSTEGLDVAEFERKIKAMQARLDEVMANQDKLF